MKIPPFPLDPREHQLIFEIPLTVLHDTLLRLSAHMSPPSHLEISVLLSDADRDHPPLPPPSSSQYISNWVGTPGDSEMKNGWMDGIGHTHVLPVLISSTFSLDTDE